MLGCQDMALMLPWKSRTARSSATSTSQIQIALGESSSRVATREDKGSKAIVAQPDRNSGVSWGLGGGDTT